MDAHTFSAQQVVNLKKDMVVDSMGVVNDRARWATIQINVEPQDVVKGWSVSMNMVLEPSQPLVRRHKFYYLEL